MQSVRSTAEIVDHQVGPIFAKTIGENSLIRWMPTQVNDRVSHGLNTADCLHRRRFAGFVPDPHLNGAVGILGVKLHYIDKIGAAA